ncbi:MAG TPA: hypothetical protein VFX35_01515 [Solirubrobacterales bacterium]|nr:hypothetical protein [Solirubrobacterales bacterium]
MPDLDALRAKLHRLREKRQDRIAKRIRQKKLFHQRHLRGYAKAAARNGRAARKLRGLISKTKRAIKRQDGTLASVEIRSTAAGPPHWGGASDLMGQFIAPFMAERFGLAKGSGKRTPAHNAAIGGSPTSDHLTTHRTTFARDFPTFSGEAAARALAAALGNEDWQANNFDSFNVTVDGITFRVQILWGSGIDHDDHVHVGVSLA